MGFSKSLVLSTLPNPTLEALMPEATFTSVMAPVAILELVIALLTTIGASAVPPISPVNFIIPFVTASASTTVVPPPPPPPTAILLSTYNFTAFVVGNFISELPSALMSNDLFSAFSFKFIRVDKAAVSLLNLLESILEVSVKFNFEFKLVLTSIVLA